MAGRPASSGLWCPQVGPGGPPVPGRVHPDQRSRHWGPLQVLAAGVGRLPWHDLADRARRRATARGSGRSRLRPCGATGRHVAVSKARGTALVTVPRSRIVRRPPRRGACVPQTFPLRTAATASGFTARCADGDGAGPIAPVPERPVTGRRSRPPAAGSGTAQAAGAPPINRPDAPPRQCSSSTTAFRPARNARSGSLLVRPIAASYASAASADRPSRRSRSARTAWNR